MDSLQVFALTVSAVQFALLLIVFIVKAAKTDQYVSEQLEALSSFRLLLTVFCLNSMLLSTVYVWIRRQRGGRLYAAIAGAGVGVVGWAMLSVSEMGTALHMTGVSAFLLGQGALLLVQYMLADAFGAAFYVGYAATGCCAVLFLVLDMTACPDTAALFEWVGFISNSGLLVLFWATNPFHPQHQQQVRAEAMPLMPDTVAAGWL